LRINHHVVALCQQWQAEAAFFGVGFGPGVLRASRMISAAAALQNGLKATTSPDFEAGLCRL
jgi:hypothetical protein